MTCSKVPFENGTAIICTGRRRSTMAKQPTPSTFDVGVLLKKMEYAETIRDLQCYGEQAKTAPECDKPLLRAMYRAKLKQLLREKPQ